MPLAKALMVFNKESMKMALPIAPTSVLEGKDVERFLKKVRLGLLKPAKLIPTPKLPKLDFKVRWGNSGGRDFRPDEMMDKEI